MSGGHFDYQQYRMRDIADTIEYDIARALQPKPAMVHEDYWIINVMDNHLSSYHTYGSYMEFTSYEEAELCLISHYDITKAEQKYVNASSFRDDTVFQSKKHKMDCTLDGEAVPVLYAIHHCVYDHYPFDSGVLELTDETIEIMKVAYRQIRIAEIYAQRVDWMMSGDDGEDDLQERLKEELEEFEKEFTNKDWTKLPEDEY